MRETVAAWLDGGGGTTDEAGTRAPGRMTSAAAVSLADPGCLNAARRRARSARRPIGLMAAWASVLLYASAASTVLAASGAAATRAAIVDSASTAEADGGAARLARELDQLLAPHKATIGLVVQRLEDGQVVYARNADTPLKPASVLKLFTTAAALERFGPDFAFETRVYLQDDDLLIVGGGDPGLGDERLATRHGLPHLAELGEWAAALRARGVQAIDKVAIDDSIFDQQHRHPDWPDDQADRWYQAPVGGVNLNDNCIDPVIRAGGGRVHVQVTPALPAALIRNEIVAAQRHAPVAARAIDSDIFEFRGTAARSGELDSVAAGRPAIFVGYAAQHALEQAGIATRGGVVRRTVDPRALRGAALLAVHRTAMPDLLWRCNNHSQNLFAECLLKALAAYEPDGRRGAAPGSWQRGAPVLRETIERLGVDTRGAVFRDGSGLSHSNRVTAAQVVDLLAAMRRHRHAALWYDSLARPGEEGSMRRRYVDPALVGRMRAKTGTIAGVRTLAGVIERDGQTTLAFALLINGPAPADLPTKVAATIARP